MADADEGKVIREGYLRKSGGKKKFKHWDNRWFRLTRTHLHYYGSHKKLKKAKGSIPLAVITELEDITVSQGKSKFIGKAALAVNTQVRTYVLFSDNESVTHAWRDDINALLARTNRRLMTKEEVRQSIMDMENSDDDLMTAVAMGGGPSGAGGSGSVTATAASATPAKDLVEDDNKGTRVETEEESRTVLRRLAGIDDSGDRAPFMVFTFGDDEAAAIDAITGLPFIAVASDSGKLVCEQPLIFGVYRVPRKSAYMAILGGKALRGGVWTAGVTSLAMTTGEQVLALSPGEADLGQPIRRSSMFISDDEAASDVVLRGSRADGMEDLKPVEESAPGSQTAAGRASRHSIMMTDPQINHEIDTVPMMTMDPANAFGESIGTFGTMDELGISPTARAEGVTFVQEERQPQDSGGEWIYMIYKAPTADAAKAFLQAKEVTKELYYIIVETPEGNFGRDIDGFFKE